MNRRKMKALRAVAAIADLLAAEGFYDEERRSLEAALAVATKEANR